MAVKSGASHALSALILTILSAILIKYAEKTRIFEGVIFFLEVLARKLINFILFLIDIELEIEIVKPILIATILCFFWGVVYYFSRK